MRVTRLRGTLLAFVALTAALATGVAWGEVLGTATGPLEAERPREKACTLGDLVADAARASVLADLALIQASQLRSKVIPAGDLTRAVLSGSLSYPDEEVVLVEMSGEQLRAALERGISMLPKPSTAFLQVSGIRVTFRSEAPPGQRLAEVRVGREVLSPGKAYRAAMPSSLAKGALGYFRIFDGLEVKQTGPALVDALCDYIRAEGTISPSAEPRLKDLSASSE
jgi:2',3'-cyclic-nucleotide 2'-phosphodiesterase (5'-nucleotidase family)